jgi:hypothetical protein
MTILINIWAVRFYDNLHLFKKTVPTAGIYCWIYRVTEKSHNPDGKNNLLTVFTVGQPNCDFDF